jgi:hypothetical protein
MAFSTFAGGPITIDHENIVKVYSVSPSMLGRGHTLLEPAGPVWVRICLIIADYVRFTVVVGYCGVGLSSSTSSWVG